MNLKKKILFVAIAFTLLVGLLYSLQGVKGLALIAGLIFAAYIFKHPLIGCVLLIFSGTCFQIIGSSHMTGLPLSLPKIFGILTLGSFIYYCYRNKPALTYSPQMAALGIFALVFIASALIQPDKANSMIGLAKFFQLYLFYFLISNLGGINKKSLLILCGALTIAIGICGLIGVMEHFLPGLSIESDDPRLGQGAIGAIMDRESIASGDIKRITGGLADANWLAYTIATVLPLTVFWWRNFTRLSYRLVTFSIIILQCLGMVLAYTRAGMLGLGVAVLVLIKKKLIPIAPMLVLVALGTLVALVWQPEGFTERIFSTKYLKEGSTPMRRDLFNAAIRMAKEKPIFGYGYGRFGYEFMDRLNTDMRMRLGAMGADLANAIERGQEQVHNIGAHSMYLEVVVEYGIVGLIPFMAFLWFVLKDLMLVQKFGNQWQVDLAICLFAGAIAFYICALFGHAKTLKCLWIVAGLAAALRRVTFESETLDADFDED
ncbi:MAG: O-antigen ligase family protein [Sedimentisphaerales bacterium]|nr:O-antigen ligase family protein [Sedimentisphaerales bacterium]